jgi:hypothetical protein
MFSTSKRTGNFRVVKETNIKDEVHYEVEFEIDHVVGGPRWETAKDGPLIYRFESEEHALIFVNNGMKSREIVKEGRVDDV